MPSCDRSTHCRQHPYSTVGFVELCATLLLRRHGLDLQHHPAAPLERSPMVADLHPASGTAPTTRLQPPSAPWSGTLLPPDSGTTATASAYHRHHQQLHPGLSDDELHHEPPQEHNSGLEHHQQQNSGLQLHRTASKQHALQLCS